MKLEPMWGVRSTLIVTDPEDCELSFGLFQDPSNCESSYSLTT